jgi:hypothetical protein
MFLGFVSVELKQSDSSLKRGRPPALFAGKTDVSVRPQRRGEPYLYF